MFQTYAEVIEALSEAENNDSVKLAVLTGNYFYQSLKENTIDLIGKNNF